MNVARRGRPQICVVAAAPLTLKTFLLGHIEAMLAMAEVTVVANFTEDDETFPWPAGIIRVAIPIARAIAPRTDLRALLALYRLFRKQRHDLVHSITPKAGLLAMLAARLTKVPTRLHTFTGQVWITRSGPARILLKNADRQIARLASHILADSNSQRDFLIAQGIVAPYKSAVIAQGSISGVDSQRFRPDADARERVRRRHGIPDGAVLFLYLGRIHRDKGLRDLAHAFAALGTEFPQVHLLLVGPEETNLRNELSIAAGGCASRLHHSGLTDRPQEYFAAADVYCLPSYREGFGTTILEAAASGIPAIGSRIYGITDAIVENETGLLFKAGDAAELALCMRSLAADSALRTRMGEAARARAVRDFAANAVTAALMDCYRALLGRQQG